MMITVYGKFYDKTRVFTILLKAALWNLSFETVINT